MPQFLATSCSFLSFLHIILPLACTTGSWCTVLRFLKSYHVTRALFYYWKGVVHRRNERSVPRSFVSFITKMASNLTLLRTTYILKILGVCESHLEKISRHSSGPVLWNGVRNSTIRLPFLPPRKSSQVYCTLKSHFLRVRWTSIVNLYSGMYHATSYRDDNLINLLNYLLRDLISWSNFLSTVDVLHSTNL